MKAHGLHLPAALVFLTSAAVTVVWCRSMSDLPGMQMPGGWTMSMAWMRMPGQSWWGAGLQFLGMWTVMMVAMMMPVLLPALVRQRRVQPRVQVGCLSVGYFSVWIAAGALLFPVGLGFAALAMNNPALSAVVPMAAGAVLLAAGLVQFSGWKTRQLQCCRQPRVPGFAFRQGLELGWQCWCCCAGLTAVLLVSGVMDPAVMAAIAMATAWERAAPDGHAARMLGGALAVAGIIAMVRALF